VSLAERQQIPILQSLIRSRLHNQSHSLWLKPANHM
jgi:hypothetical protein